MIRCAALLTLLLPAAICAQQQPTALALPDSSYLKLTLELPIAGNFLVTEWPTNGGQQRFVSYALSDVRMAGCTLIWRAARRVQTDVRAQRVIHEIKVPLKALNPARVGLRNAAMNPYWRREPAVLELYGYVRNRGERPIESRPLQAGDFLTRNSDFVIPLAEGELPEQLLHALRDAIQRCDSWNTKPIPAIR